MMPTALYSCSLFAVLVVDFDPLAIIKRPVPKNANCTHWQMTCGIGTLRGRASEVGGNTANYWRPGSGE
jgi:hypothetical protein